MRFLHLFLNTVFDWLCSPNTTWIHSLCFSVETCHARNFEVRKTSFQFYIIEDHASLKEMLFHLT